MGALKNLRVLQYVLAAALVVFALHELSGAVHDLSDLYPFRRELNYWWLALALFAEALQYVSDGYFVRETLTLLGYRLSLIDTIRISAFDISGTAFLPLGRSDRCLRAYICTGCWVFREKRFCSTTLPLESQAYPLSRCCSSRRFSQLHWAACLSSGPMHLPPSL